MRDGGRCESVLTHCRTSYRATEARPRARRNRFAAFLAPDWSARPPTTGTRRSVLHNGLMAAAIPESSIVLPTRAGAVAERLRDLIRSGELPSGAHLRQDEIAARFGVSTTPVREAFVALEREGLVRRHPHRGVVVFVPSVEELDEVYEIRAMLEPLATEIATKKLTEDDLVALERIVADMRTARPKRYLELNDAAPHSDLRCGRPAAATRDNRRSAGTRGKLRQDDHSTSTSGRIAMRFKRSTRR